MAFWNKKEEKNENRVCITMQAPREYVEELARILEGSRTIEASIKKHDHPDILEMTLTGPAWLIEKGLSQAARFIKFV